MSKQMKDIVCDAADVEILAAADDSGGPSKFNVVAYTGGAMNIRDWDLPVVIDLDGLSFGRSLVANLDHDSTKRVGHVTSKTIEGGKLILGGVASAATESRREVIESAAESFTWQASVEVTPTRVEQIAKGKTVEVNGQSFNGPLYVTRAGTLKGFAFVSHGADDNTQVSIAASAENSKRGKNMNAEFKSWVESIGFDADSLTADQLAGLEANYNGKPTPKPTPIKAGDPFEARKIEAKRREDIRQVADRVIDQRASSFEEITEIEGMVHHAIEAKMGVTDFRLQLYEAMVPQGVTINAPRRCQDGITPRVLEAAICQTARLEGHEKQFSDQELQIAHSNFRNGIGLKELMLICARQNGYSNGHSYDYNEDVLRYAFGQGGGRPIHASGGFSTNSIATIVSNTANKFLREGWMAVDMTPLRIAPVRSVRDFKQITTVSLTGHLQFEQVGSTGLIKHGDVGETTYTNQAKTYGRMLAIPRQDIINDDVGALTSGPRRLGRGAGLKLNDIFWAEFLDNSAFFTSGRSNVNEAVADMTIGGLTATEVIFMNQVDPDSKPLGIMPKILLVPTALKAAAIALTDPQSQMITGSDVKMSNVNVFRGRFRVESSPYMSNSSYTGYSAAAWYMLADPQEMPVIEIAALNGRVEPVVETTEADFSTLGIQMRGYSDVGVSLQEYRGGVRADGGAS